MNKFLFGLFCGAIITGFIAYYITNQNAEKETD